MPRRSILSAAERESLLALPDTKDELIRHYTFSESDLSIIRQRRGPANRLGFAVQLCYLRFPGVILGADEPPFPPLLRLVANQLKVGIESWDEYGQREQTRREHLVELQTVFGFQPFTIGHYRQAVQLLTELAMQTDKGIVLARALIEHLRRQSVIVPALNAIEVLRSMNSDNARKVPTDAPTEFIKPRWQKLVMTDTGIDRRYYELCALSELKNALRSGDIWVQGSRQFKDFEDYLVPPAKFASLKQASELPLAVATDCDQYLHDRLTLLETQLATVNRMALANELPDAIITESGLKITPLDAAVPDTAQALIDQTAMILPHVKITELLLEVDEWTGFTRHFAHLKSGDLAKDKNLLLTTILADAINLGLTKMAESCPGTTYAKLAWLQAWHIRDETYGAALAELVNAQFRHPFAEHWGDGTTSSSDGQNFRTGSKAESTGHINPKYGSSPGRTFYTHISDQYAPFHTKVVNVGVRDSTYVLDGLLYHESDLRIEEHYTDTAGFTDHVFALMHLLGFRFAPRIRDLGDTKLYIPKGDATYEALKPMIGGTLNIKHVRAHWDEILRMATSIKQGTATASLMLRKLGSYPRQNGLAVALRELGRIERTLFILDWLQSVELRRRVHAGLNKGEARNALARAVFFNRLGEIRDRSFEQQRYRASGLNLVTAAIVLWNTVYLERAANALRGHGQAVDDGLLQYLSPLGWEHINLTGDYLWRSSAKIGAGKFRPLRPLQPA
ncbi:transposase [Klebsiella pneumoniae]|uniref:Tn3 family transposase n=1 Tax=Klebsiella pneumoniae TaxID=573 RepID=UPI000E2CB302|nr:Tn3 family transposase [Klebsiella pneumoniae]SWW79517.1 transposase [Klebsiella pneumoniae]